MINKNHCIILVLVLCASFFIHIFPYFVLDNAKYNFYDTDTWYSVRQIERISNGEDFQYDELLDYPEGRDINWGETLPIIGSVFVNKDDCPIDIFNKVGFLSPLLSLLFTIVIYFLVSRLFNPFVGLYAAILLSVGTGIFFQNCFFGIIDHHLIESILFTISIISIVLYIKEKHICWVATASIMAAVLFFTSSQWPLYWVLFFICIFIYMVDYTWNKNKIAIVTVVGVSGVVVYAAICILLERWTALWNWIEPISEISYSDPLLLIVRFNILFVPILFGVSIFVVTPKKLEEFILIIITALLFVLTMRFTRMEYILYPIIIVLSAYYIDKYFSKRNSGILLSVFIVISIILGGTVVSGMVDNSNNNSDWNGAIEYLQNQPTGVVLSWWDYGHWIVAAANQPPLSDPFQDNVIKASNIFTSDGVPILDGISYIVVTKNDERFYGAMVWYSNSNVTYNNSFLKKLIDGDMKGLVFDNGFCKIYKT